MATTYRATIDKCQSDLDEILIFATLFVCTRENANYLIVLSHIQPTYIRRPCSERL